MANISTELVTIRTSVYGKDMRAAIADGLEKVNDESSEVYDQIDIVVESAEIASQAAAQAQSALTEVYHYTPEGWSDLLSDVEDVTSWELARDSSDPDYIVIKGSDSQTHGSVYAPASQISSVIDTIYPIGSIYMSTVNADPATFLTGTTWTRIEDRFLIGASNTYAAGTPGGSAEHTLTISEMPAHTHTVKGQVRNSSSGSGVQSTKNIDGTSGGDNHATTSAGGGQPFSIMPPYLPVYMWTRTA